MTVSQKEFLLNLCEKNPNALIVGSIGTISYDLKDIPHEKKILVKGAMGHVMGIGLGYALGNPNENIIIVIGDGSYLMKMGSAATILKHALPNLSVFIINNQSYASCGGQGTDFNYIKQYVPFVIHDIPTGTLSC